MKKSTKNKIIVLFVILVLFSSSFAFIVLGVYNFNNGEQNTPQQLDQSVIKGEITQETELAYIQAGYTFLKYYYKEGAFLGYIESLPETFRTNNGVYQLFVQEIPSENEYMTVTSAKNVVNVDNLTQGSIFSALCETVSFKPAECIIGTLFNTT